MGGVRGLLFTSLVVVSGGGWGSVSSLLKRLCLSDNLPCSVSSLVEGVRTFDNLSDCSTEDTDDNGIDGPSLRGKLKVNYLLIYLPLLFSLHLPLLIGVDVSKLIPVAVGGVDSDGGPADVIGDGLEGVGSDCVGGGGGCEELMCCGGGG